MAMILTLIFPFPILDEMTSMLVLLPQGCVQLSYKHIYSIINFHQIESARLYNKRLVVKLVSGKKKTLRIDLKYFEFPETIGQKIIDAHTHFKATCE
jgi:hypothetical protein